MKRKNIFKITSFIMAIALLIGVTIPAYAMESSTNLTQKEIEEKSISEDLTRTIPTLNLGYGEAKNLTSGITIKNKTYTYVGSVVLPDDDRIHRIIYKASFKKGDNDTGGGDVSLDVKFLRNGVEIHKDSYRYLDRLGYTDQVEVTGLSKNQVIDVYLDASSVNPSESDGSIRQIYLYYIQFYTD